MILSSNQELRLHLPSNAVDEVANLQGMLDNSEKDFLKPRLGASLYDRLCKQYASIDPSVFCDAVTDGTYTNDPWNELLLYAQRMIVNDAMAQNIEKQAISVNGSGINVASSNDYAVATDKQIAQGKESYRQSAMTSLNNLLSLLEGWAKEVNTPMPIAADGDGAESSTPSDGSNQGSSSEGTDSSKDDAAETAAKQHEAIEEIVTLWQESSTTTIIVICFFLPASLCSRISIFTATEISSSVSSQICFSFRANTWKKHLAKTSFLVSCKPMRTTKC